MVEFYSDGDGDFRPTFEFDRKYEQVEAKWKTVDNSLPDAEVLFDAGFSLTGSATIS